MTIVLTLLFLFMIGSCGGWVIELFFRRFFTAKRWINPGFLVGPYLPLYGFGLTSLYVMSRIDMSFITNIYLQKTILIIVMALIVTLIEYIAGLIFIKGLHVKLWDYTNRWGNIQGLICPLFSAFWLVACAAYNLLADKYIVSLSSWFKNNIAFSFFVGVFVGVIIIDCFYSFHVASKIKAIAEEKQIVVKWEAFKEEVAERNEKAKEKVSFLLPFKSITPIKEHIESYIEKHKIIKKDNK